MCFVTAPCPDCGLVEIDLEQVVLMTSEDGPAWCVLRCSSCGTRFAHDVDQPMSAALQLVGVRVQTWEPPADRWVGGVLAPLTPAAIERWVARLDSEPAWEALLRGDGSN